MLSRRVATLAQIPNLYAKHVRWHGFLTGSFRFAWLLASKILERVLGYESLFLYRKEIAPQAYVSESGPRIRFRKAQGSDALAIRRLHQDREEDFVNARLENGETCYVAHLDGGQMCAYLWTAPGARFARYRSSDIQIPEKEVYVRDVLTLPEFRGQGMTPRFLNWLNDELARQGKVRMWAAIMGSNYSSQRSFSKVGFVIDKKFYYLSLPFSSREFVYQRRELRKEQD